MSDRAQTRGGGLSRRQLITRGAIAGGLVWAAPVIRTTAAYATTANGTERPCINFYMVVVNPDGQVRAAPGNVHAAEVPPAIRRWFDDNPAVQVQFPAVHPQLTGVTNEAAAVLLPEVTGPNASGRQCRMVLGWARKGNSFKEAYVDPNPPIAGAVGRRLIFPCPRGDTSSHDALQSSAVSDTTTSTSTTTTTSTTTPPVSDTTADTTADNGAAAGVVASNALGSDGASGGTLGSDGSTGTGVGSDGARSSGGQGNPGGPDNGTCFSALYLIYCCPR